MEMQGINIFKISYQFLHQPTCPLNVGVHFPNVHVRSSVLDPHVRTDYPDISVITLWTNAVIRVAM